VVSGVTSNGLVTSAEVSASELDEMAKIEHASWMKYLQDNGWRYGQQRNDHHHVHPSLRAWNNLTPEDQEKTREGVANALRVLNQLGYRSTVLRPQVERSDRDSSSSWVEVSRRGEVTAVRSDVSWTWTSESGETMRGEAGDWRVTNESGRSWSVAPKIFANTYEHIDGSRWRRTGRAQARPAVSGEVIRSLEGRQTATDGDWVIRGSNGEEWVTNSDHFAASYEISEPSSQNVP
jgi:hypothetical protein